MAEATRTIALSLLLGCPVLALAGPSLAASPAPSATASPNRPAPDPLKVAFEALTETDRRAVQDALIWTGDFNSTVTGGYGPRTRDALAAFSKRAGSAPDTALDPVARARLLAEAGKARGAVGFAVVRDARAGFRIGVPGKLAPKRSDLVSGTRYEAQDGSVVLDTLGRPAATPDDLATIFDRLTRDAPNRRVTYKLARPDFVVVAGETGDRKFYARYAFGSGPSADPASPGGATATTPAKDGAIRGFALSYPKGSPTLDAVAIAVAASFDPFPAPPARVPAQAENTPASTVPPALPALVLTGQVLVVAPGLALSAVPASRCENADVGGASPRWLTEDAASGLSLLSLPGHADAQSLPLADGTAAGSGPLLALFYVGDGAAPVLTVAGASLGPDARRATTSIQGGGAGAPLTDPSGALAAVVMPRSRPSLRVAGVVPSQDDEVVDASRISTFLRGAHVGTSLAGTFPASPAEVVARWRPLVLPLRCTGSRTASAP